MTRQPLKDKLVTISRVNGTTAALASSQGRRYCIVDETGKSLLHFAMP